MNACSDVETNELTQPIYDAIEGAQTGDQVHEVLFHRIPLCNGISTEEREGLIQAAVARFKTIFPPSEFGRRQPKVRDTRGCD